MGNLLFSIRNIPFVPQEKLEEITAHWYKMTKTSSGFTKGNIELLMAIAITKDACGTPEDGFSDEDSSVRKYLSQRDSGRDLKGQIYQELLELEHWKRKQKNEFLCNLKQKEEVLLNHLSNQWSNQRTEESDKLAQNLRDCVELKESLEREHKTLRELMAKSERCKCRQESQGEESSKQILLENERLRKENKALKEKFENESSLKEEIQLLTKELVRKRGFYLHYFTDNKLICFSEKCCKCSQRL